MIEIILTFFIGIFIGSFLNVLIYRLPRNESIAYPPSHCPHCKHKIRIYDLFPIISYILLNGKCRNCKAHISLQYPVIEFITGVLFVLSFFHAQSISQAYDILFLVHLIFALVVSCSLLVIFMIDLRSGIIPFKVLVPAFAVTLLYLILTNSQELPLYLLSGLGAGGFFLLIFLFTKGRGMGFGDVVYAFFMGVLLGFPGIVAGLYIAFLTGAVISLVLIGKGLKKFHGDSIPFGPFLVFGTYIIFFWGDSILKIVNNILIHLP